MSTRPLECGLCGYDHPSSEECPTQEQKVYRVTVNAKNFQSANDEATATTTFGGSVHLKWAGGDEDCYCHGTDRDSVNCYDDLLQLICQALGVVIDIDTMYEREDFYQDFSCKIDGQETFDVVRNADSTTLQIVPVGNYGDPEARGDWTLILHFKNLSRSAVQQVAEENTMEGDGTADSYEIKKA